MTEQADNAQILTRLAEEVERLEGEIHKISNKLNNEGFLARVPAAFIEKEQKKMAVFQHNQAKIKEKIASLRST